MKRTLLRIDWLLLVPVTVLIIVGLTVLFSVNPTFFKSQLLALVIGIMGFLLFSQMYLPLLRSLSFPIYIASLISFFIILLIGIESHGAVRWIDILGVRLQFSEIFKPLLIISFASFITDSRRTSVKSFFFFFVMLSPLVLLLFLQPDLGNALIYVGVSVLALLIYGYPLYLFLIGLIPLVIVSPFMWFLLHDYQRQRIMTFLHPKKDVLGTSYNVIQATIAVGSGMLMGRGLGEGTQSGLRFLPERQTDFIFATLSEGLGFIGSVVVLLALLFLCFRMYRVYLSLSDPFYKLVTASLLCLLVVHIFVNIGMNLGLLPIVGITLPFVSLGGSSLLSNMILVGIVSNISTTQIKEQVLEIK